MYILASDYDGTLKTRIHDLYVNIHELKKFRKLGNKFILATGREFSSIKSEIETFSIPIDYLTCNDGAVTFDSSFNVMNAHFLSDNQVYEISELVNEYPGLVISNFYTPTHKTKEKTDLIEVEVTKRKDLSFRNFVKNLDINIPGLSRFAWRNTLYIKTKTSKSESVMEIVNGLEESVNFDNIYAIGDEKNDEDMIRMFKGYRIIESSPALWIPAGFRVVPEVHHLIKYLNNKTKRTK